jgi:hypothetical protein
LAGGTPADMLFAALFAPRITAAVAPLRRTHAAPRCSLHQGTLGRRIDIFVAPPFYGPQTCTICAYVSSSPAVGSGVYLGAANTTRS